MRKRILLVAMAAIMSLAGYAQFEQNKFYVGASLSGLDLNYSGSNKLSLGVSGQAGYFLADNLLAIGQVSYQHYGNSDVSDVVQIGAGGRYYIIQNGLFLGATANYFHGKDYDDFVPEIEVGYAFFLNHYLTLEPAIYYDQSFKSHSDYSKIGLRVRLGFYF